MKGSVNFAFLFATLLIFAQITTYSQEQKASERINGGMGYFMAGGHILSISSLNTRLANRGYPKFSSTFTSFGGGGHAVISNFIIGGEGHGIIGSDQTNDKSTLSLSAGYGLVDFGYLMYSKGGLSVYPLVGFGGAGLSLNISQRQIPTFDEVLDSLKGHVELSTGSFLLHFAIGVDYLLSFGKQEDSRGGLLIGLRIGATFTPVAGDWKFDEIKVANGPSVGINGVYLRLMFGGGGISRQ